jgi:hypothetical protein
MEPRIGLHVRQHSKYRSDGTESFNVLSNKVSKEPTDTPTDASKPTTVPKIIEDPKDARPIVPKLQSLKLKQQKVKFKPPPRYIGATASRPASDFSLVPPALPPPPPPSLDVRDLPATSLQKRKRKTQPISLFTPVEILLQS